MGGGTSIIIPFSSWAKCKGLGDLGLLKRGQTHFSQLLEQCSDHIILVALELGVFLLSRRMCENFLKNTGKKALVNRNNYCTFLNKEHICVIMCGQNT